MVQSKFKDGEASFRNLAGYGCLPREQGPNPIGCDIFSYAVLM